MAKKLKAIRATDKLSALARDVSKKAESWSTFLSAEVKDGLLSSRDMLLSLASKLPKKLMIHADVAEGEFTIAFLKRLSDEQLADLNEAVNLHEGEDVFLFFYTQHQGKCEHLIELKDFENFDFSKILGISFNGNTAPLIYHMDSIPIYYVSVTFTVA